jgi:hypothetical protein
MSKKIPLHFAEKFYLSAKSRLECWNLILQSEKVAKKYRGDFQVENLRKKIDEDCDVIGEIKTLKKENELGKSQNKKNSAIKKSQIIENFKVDLENAKRERNVAIEKVRADFQQRSLKLRTEKEKSLENLKREASEKNCDDSVIAKLKAEYFKSYEIVKKSDEELQGLMQAALAGSENEVLKRAALRGDV